MNKERNWVAFCPAAPIQEQAPPRNDEDGGGGQNPAVEILEQEPQQPARDARLIHPEEEEKKPARNHDLS